MVRLSAASAAFFFLALIVLPFNNIPVHSKLFGEFSREAFFYPMLLSSFFCCARFVVSRESLVPFPGIAGWGVFLLWIAVGGLVNLNGILTAETQGRSGWEKFLVQFLVICAGMVFGYTAYIIAEGRRFGMYLRRAVFIGIFVTMVYAVLEVIYLFGLSDGGLLSVLNNFMGANQGLYYRVRSVCTESSWYAIYMGLAFPFLYVKVLLARRFSLGLWGAFVAVLLIFVLMLSRTADGILVFSVGAVTAAAGFSTDKSIRTRALVLMAVSIMIYGLTKAAVTSVSGNVEANPRIFAQIEAGLPHQSNNTRYHGMMAALKLGSDNPFFGAGVAQYAFRGGDYLDKNAIALNSELREYWVKGTAWPVSYVIYARLIAETGVPGLLIWLSCLLLPAVAVVSRIRAGGDWSSGAVLLALIVNVAFTGLSQDSFRFLGYWLVPALSYAYSSGRLTGIFND